MDGANASIGGDQITFTIAPGSPAINVGTPLPAIIGSDLTIDGTIPSGGGPVQIDGAGAGLGASGFVIEGQRVTIKGFRITGFGGDGIDIRNSNNNVVIGNYVGIAANGSRLPNGDSGIEINGSSQGNRIGGLGAGERNVVSGNSGIGVQLLGIVRPDGSCLAPQNNLVEGNYLGLDAQGKKPSPYGNQGAGLGLSVCAQNNAVRANVASGNHDDGIQLDGRTGPAGTANVCNNTIQGNIVGLDPSGSVTRPNVDDGIDIDRGSCNNLVGGTVAGARNIIAGNASDGVDLHEKSEAGTATNGNAIVGNLIGLAADASTPIPNLQNGVNIRFTTQNNTVEGNVIAGNGASGVTIETGLARANTVRNNKIGTLADGTTLRGNGGSGVYVTGGAFQNRIEANTIAGNTLDGVAIEQLSNSTAQTRQNTITHNRIWSNGGLGIDLLPVDGVNANDGATSATVGNLGLDFPVITQATTSSAKGTAPPGSVVELFSAQADAGETNGEGSAFAASVTAGSDGSWCIDGVSLGSLVTATATDASGNTSEFAANVATSGSLSLCATPPTNTSLPKISGITRVGQALTGSRGEWSGTAPLSFTVQWRRCDASGGACAGIAGATGESYRLTRNDIGSRIRFRVTASNSAGTASVSSPATAVVLAAKRPPQCVVPNVIRKSLKKAIRIIRRAHCRVGRIRKVRSTRRLKGRVLREKPRPRTRHRSGTRVNLWVGRGR
jgi:hypothetical protein